MEIEGKIAITATSTFSFVIQNGYTAQNNGVVANVMAVGMIPIGAVPLIGDLPMQIADLNGAEEIVGVCTSSLASLSTNSSCSTTLTGIAQNRSLYALKVELQCNSHGANLAVRAGGSPINGAEVLQSPTWCHDQCQRYHTVVDWTQLQPELIRTNSGSLDVDISAAGLQTDYCGAGDMLKAVFTLRVSNLHVSSDV